MNQYGQVRRFYCSRLKFLYIMSCVMPCQCHDPPRHLGTTQSALASRILEVVATGFLRLIVFNMHHQFMQSYGGNAAYGSSDPGYGYGAPPQQPYGGYGAPYQQIVDPSQALTGGRQIGKAPSARKNKKNTIGKAKAKAKEAWTELDQNVRIGISVAMMLVGVLFLRMVIVDPDILFFIAEGIHAFGVAMLLWKIHRKQSVGGISLGMQLLTAIFIGSRFMCALFLEASWSNFFGTRQSQTHTPPAAPCSPRRPHTPLVAVPVLLQSPITSTASSTAYV